MKCSGNTRVVPWLDSGLQMLWPLSSPAWRTKISSHAAWPKTKNNISGPKSDTNYEANDTHRRLSLSSPEKAPFMSSMVQEISLFFRSLVKKERYWNWHQICNKRYRLFSFFFLIKVAQMRRAVIYVIIYSCTGQAFAAMSGLPPGCVGFSACGSRAQLLCGMWNPPGPGIKPVSPAFLGVF